MSDVRRSNVARLVALLCLLGAARIAVFAAAYPPFVYIDEALHYEVVWRYAHTGIPPGREDDLLAPEPVRTWVTYGIHQAGGRSWPTEEQRQRAIDAEVKRIIVFRNCELFTPPLYYTLAAGWYRLGEAIGLSEPHLLYWLRMLAAPLYAVAIWLACRICLDMRPGHPQLAIAVGLLLAVLPQDVLYTVNSDALGPLTGAILIFLLTRWVMSERPSVLLAAGLGLAASGALLVKYSNVGILAALPVGIGLVLRRRSIRIPEAAALMACAVAPVGLWMLRSHLVLGDWSASYDKAHQLSWKPLTFAQSLEHPIFTLVGWLEFLPRLAATFWRGELIWGQGVQRLAAADWFYLGLTAVAMIGVAGWLMRPSSEGRADRPLALLCLAAVAGSVLFLALISARFDYGRSFFPSRGFPYFAAGRLMTAAIVPFGILLMGGISELARPRRLHPALVAGVALAVISLGSELYLCAMQSDPGGTTVFAAPGNFYHPLTQP